MGQTTGCMWDNSSTCHQESSFFPSLCRSSMVSVHPQAGLSPGGRMATEVPGLIVAHPSGQKERSIPCRNSWKDWESVFPRSPSPANQPCISLAWTESCAHSLARHIGQVNAFCWLAGMGDFPDWPIPTLGSVAFLKAPGWGKQSSGYCWGRREVDMGRVTVDIHCTVSSIETLLIWTNCWDNSERKFTLN